MFALHSLSQFCSASVVKIGPLAGIVGFGGHVNKKDFGYGAFVEVETIFHGSFLLDVLFVNNFKSTNSDFLSYGVDWIIDIPLTGLAGIKIGPLLGLRALDFTESADIDVAISFGGRYSYDVTAHFSTGILARYHHEMHEGDSWDILATTAVKF